MVVEWERTGTAELSIDCELLKRFCRNVDDFELPLLELFAAAAAEQIETETRLAIRTQTQTAELSICSPAETVRIDLPRGPFLSAEVIAIAADETETPIPAGSIRHNRLLPGAIRVCSIPAGTARLRVTYLAGYDELPAAIRLLIFQVCAHWYEHREAATADGKPQEIPLSYSHIVRSLDTYQDAVQ